MNNQLHSFTFSSFERGEQLPDELIKLLREASQAAGKAYAPYSQFHVGAALELVDGTIIHGCNQENASYPCGEFEMKNKAQIQLILGTEYGKTLVFESVSDLLPFAFEPEFLLNQ